MLLYLHGCRGSQLDECIPSPAIVGGPWGWPSHRQRRRHIAENSPTSPGQQKFPQIADCFGVFDVGMAHYLWHHRGRDCSTGGYGGTDCGQEWKQTGRDYLQRKSGEAREANGPIRFWGGCLAGDPYPWGSPGCCEACQVISTATASVPSSFTQMS
jgi:hypothetical protein